MFTGNNVGAVDYWATKCEGVESPQLVGMASWGSTSGDPGSIDTGDEYSSLVRCLGDSNGIEIDNVEVYNWDYGSWSTRTPRATPTTPGTGPGRFAKRTHR